MTNTYLFTSESVTEGHPDKVCDQISDAILDAMLSQDSKSRVAAECAVSTGLVLVTGEITSKANVDFQELVRSVIAEIGYTAEKGGGFDAASCAILTALNKQSPDIASGVDHALESRPSAPTSSSPQSADLADETGAGDQGMMFGYATNETEDYMPLALNLAHKLLEELAVLRRENKQIKYLRPDAKSQVTLEYDDNNRPVRIEAIVISTQHDDFDSDDKMLSKIKKDMINIVIPRVKAKYPKYRHLFNDKIKYHINPTGKFVIGGPHGDTGLTGRKIIVDTYGGHGAHGGGAFSGKDPTKVDRSACYMARYAAKSIVAAGLAKRCLVQVAYAIGVAEPVSLLVQTFGTETVSVDKINTAVRETFSFKPANIISSLKLTRPIYTKTAAYGHFGRKDADFTWEATDKVEKLKSLAR